jgi:hypothetical protein
MLPPALKSRFEECRRELSPWARSDLDRLAVKLNMFEGAKLQQRRLSDLLYESSRFDDARFEFRRMQGISLLRSLRAMRSLNRYGPPREQRGIGYQRSVDAGNTEHAGNADEFQFAVSSAPGQHAERESPVYHGQ